jgi:GPN-loop GTPase
VVNLDPANDVLPYDCDIDVCELISCADVMDAFGLGPNGALLYAIQHIAENLDWLEGKLRELPGDGSGSLSGAYRCVWFGCVVYVWGIAGRYLLIDCPGQAELFTNSDAFLSIVKFLTDKMKIQVSSFRHCDPHVSRDCLAASRGTLGGLAPLFRPFHHALSIAPLSARHDATGTSSCQRIVQV